MSKSELFNSIDAYMQAKIPKTEPIKHEFKSNKPNSEFIECYTDGGCHNYGQYKGIGAWAWYIKDDMQGNSFQGSCGVVDTTNNEMELMALCSLMKYLLNNKHQDEPIKIYCDSNYVVSTINDCRYINWLYNGWRTVEGEPVKNARLWADCIEMYKQFSNLELIHIRGHRGIYGNEKCDKLCSQEMQYLKYKKQRGKL